MNKNKIFAIFILLALLITCASVSFASSDFNDSFIDDSDFDDYLDENLYDNLDDNDYNLDDDSDYDLDEYDDNLNDESDYGLDEYDNNLDDESDDEGWDEDDWDYDYDDDWDYDLDDDDWDYDYDDDWDYDLDDDDWDYDYDDDWIFDIDYDYWYYDDLDFHDSEWEYELGYLDAYDANSTNFTAKYLKKTSLTGNFTRHFYLTACAYGAASNYRYDASESSAQDNETDANYCYNSTKAYHMASFMPTSRMNDNAGSISSVYGYSASKSIDLPVLSDNPAASEAQVNKTDDDNTAEMTIVEPIEEDNILAFLAMIILCLISII